MIVYNTHREEALRSVHLTETELKVFKVLTNNRWNTMKEISKQAYGEDDPNLNKGSIRQAVWRMRNKGFNIKGRAGFGYLLEDSVYIE